MGFYPCQTVFSIHCRLRIWRKSWRSVDGDYWIVWDYSWSLEGEAVEQKWVAERSEAVEMGWYESLTSEKIALVV